MTMAMLCSNASNMRLVKHRKLQAVSHENRRVPSQCYPAFEIRPKKRTNIKPGLALRGYPSLKSNITIGKSPIFNKKYVDSIHAGFSSPVFRWFVGTVRDLPCWIPPPLARSCPHDVLQGPPPETGRNHHLSKAREPNQHPEARA